MSVGMVAVIVTGGIDLSVGSTMGLVGVVCGVILQAGQHWALAIGAGLLAGMAVGMVNGLLIAYVGLSPFVVTLGMLSFARSVAIVLSQNKMIYNFGPYKPGFKAIGGGEFLYMSNMVWVLIILVVVVGVVLKLTTWGRHLFSIGGNEQAARLTGVPVDRVKMTAYILSGFTAAVAAILVVGWQGSAINALGTGYELKVIASTVIGGANLMGGEGSTYGAFVGAALLEVIRNSLLMQGIDSNWQGAFVGVFIVLAVLLEKIRGRRRA
jgi:ribose transport system permease protein